jgi:transcriptional regulator with PAS, ATPase and Fis domain
MESGEPTSYVQLIDCANGGPVYLAERMKPVFGKDGEVSAIIALLYDITGEVKRKTARIPEEKPLPVTLAPENGLAIIGESKAIEDVFRRIEAIASTETTVLITGESGTGKELVADAIHRLSKRSAGPLIKVNCAALPESIIESELFGHVKGAFTSAVQTRIGRFEAANKGTIFLDEIGEISPAVQLRLLRVLDERTVEKVGDYKPIKVDVRIIAATNQDLAELVDKGKFRKDLYYRLRVFNVHTPPLRERPDDIPLLASHFLAKFSRALGKRIDAMSTDGMQLLLKHSWPGNIRELMNVVESVCAVSHGKTISSEQLMQVFEPKGNHVVGSKSCMEMEIREALRMTRGNKAKAAKLLGIARRTLYRRIERYGIVTDVSQ